MTLSVVIPFYNEEQSIPKVVNGLINSLEEGAIDYRLVLVNNGSMDDSPRMLEDYAREKSSRIKVVHVPINRGYGWGVINGLKAASGEYIGYMWGDGQIRSDDVVKVFNHLVDGNYDLAKARRVVRKDGVIRKVLSLGYNFLFWLMFSIRTRDVNGSPKIFKSQVLQRIEPQSRDWFIDAEILIKAKSMRLKVGEVPVEFLPREKGRSHVRFTTILEFAKNMLNYRFGKDLRQWKQKTLKS